MSRSRTRRIKTRAIKFAGLIATGSSQINAWREVNPNWVNLDEPEQHNQAYRFAHHPIVEAEIIKQMQQVSASSIMSASAYAARVAHRADSLLKENATAAAAYDRLLGSTIGALRETLDINDRGQTAEQLLEKLVRSGIDRRIAMKLLGMVAEPLPAQPKTG